MSRSALSRLLAACAVLGLAATPVRGQFAEVSKIRFKQVGKVQPDGDVDIVNDLKFPTKLYANIKRTITNTAMLLRWLQMTDAAAELQDVKAEFDDARCAIRVTATILGAMKNPRGKDWFGEIIGAENYEVIDEDPDAIMLQAVNQLDNGILVNGTTRLEFPEGTKEIRFDKGRGGVLCRMPPPEAPPEGAVDTDMEIKVRPELMSCFYKVYGNPKFTNLWVAKAVFRNTGGRALQDFRVRFRIPEYASWSPWKKTKTVYPGQTVVEAYYPILLHKVHDLKSASPASMEVAWSYKTPEGELVEDSDARRLTILGLNDVVFSSVPNEESTTWFEDFNYSPLIGATFVSHTDPLIQRFAGMAAKLAGGAGARLSDENAYRFMKAAYDLICLNGIKYQTPPFLWKKGARQHVKFGRDVLRNRAGTCIDLAILYASTCQAGGLDPCLVMVPGHCFPAIKLPGGGVQAVEATMVSGNVPFQKAAEQGRKELNEAMQKGMFILVDVAKLRAAGVPTPELPDLPPSALSDWGIQATGTAQASPAPQPPQPVGNLQPVTGPGGAYTIAFPPNWQVQQQGPAIGASDPTMRASVYCESMGRQMQNLQQFAQAMIALWKQSVPGWTMVGQQTIQAGSTPVLQIGASGRPGGVEMYADYYLTLTNENQHLLMLSYPQAESGQWQPVMGQIAGSWQFR